MQRFGTFGRLPIEGIFNKRKNYQMTKLGKKKKAIEVFQTYGIHLTGQRKNADFFKELNMDKVFVDGLIFELEIGLGKELPEEKLPDLTNPQKLLQELFLD